MGKWTMASIENHGRSQFLIGNQLISTIAMGHGFNGKLLVYQRVGDGKCWGMLRGLVNRMSSTWFSSWPSWFIQGRTVQILAMTGKWRPDLESKNMKNLIAWRWKLIFNPHVLVFNRNLWHFPRFPMFQCWKVEHQPTQRPIGFLKQNPAVMLFGSSVFGDDPWPTESQWMNHDECPLFHSEIFNAVRKKAANRQCSALASGTLVLHLLCSIFLLPPSEPRLKAIFFG